MTKALKTLSYIGLILTIVPAFLVFMQVLNVDAYKKLTLAGTLIWFVTSPFWINTSKED